VHGAPSIGPFVILRSANCGNFLVCRYYREFSVSSGVGSVRLVRPWRVSSPKSFGGSTLRSSLHLATRRDSFHVHSLRNRLDLDRMSNRWDLLSRWRGENLTRGLQRHFLGHATFSFPCGSSPKTMLWTLVLYKIRLPTTPPLCRWRTPPSFRTYKIKQKGNNNKIHTK